LWPIRVASQDKKPAATSNLDKAMAYIKANHRQIGYEAIPSLFAGIAFLLDGNCKEDLEHVIQRAIRCCRGTKVDNQNWFIAYGAFFLSIIYLRDPREDIRLALEGMIPVAEKSAESTGGWCHCQGGDWKGYLKGGGGLDISMITATMLSAFLMMKSGGIDVPKPLLERTIKNLTEQTRGCSMGYGSGHGWMAGGPSRSSMAFIGLHVAKMTSAWIYGPLVQGLPGWIKNVEEGHAYGPMHFFSVSAALHLMGQFPAFANHWLPVLAGRQQEDGSVIMYNDGKRDGEKGFTNTRVGSTAVYAIMLLLKDGKKLIEVAKKEAKPGEPSKKPASPFSQKK
jgi:hypothetical protein